jgi:hypothetical protein
LDRAALETSIVRLREALPPDCFLQIEKYVI